MTTAASIRGVSKRFGATHALAAVSLQIETGTVHAIVGQNGAGKSTLGKLLGGVYRPDSGLLTVLGTEVEGWSPRDALAKGVAMIHQELSLVPDLTVADNVFLGIEKSRMGFLTQRGADRFAAINARPNFRLDPGARVSTLRVADRQKVEILRALARDARLIVMDEPTSALSIDEAQQLYEILAWLRSDGRPVVYVSHFLDEVLAHCDVVTVMRDGAVIRTGPTDRETKASLVTAMLGRPMELAIPEPAPVDVNLEPVLRVEGLAAPANGVVDISFDVRPGEIVGLAGLVGSGRTEACRAIFGVDPSATGSVSVGGTEYVRRSPRRSVAMGLGMIPEDRRHQGLILRRDVRENVALAHLTTGRMFGLVDRAAEGDGVEALLADLDVVPRRLEALVATMSGGNQQKVLFAKWIEARPKVLHTRGVDIGAKSRIYQLIKRLAASGLAIVLVSSELEEVMRLSHRVVLVHAGRTIGWVDPRSTSVDDVVLQLFGLHDVKGAA